MQKAEGCTEKEKVTCVERAGFLKKVLAGISLKEQVPSGKGKQGNV